MRAIVIGAASVLVGVSLVACGGGGNANQKSPAYQQGFNWGQEHSFSLDPEGVCTGQSGSVSTNDPNAYKQGCLDGISKGKQGSKN